MPSSPSSWSARVRDRRRGTRPVASALISTFLTALRPAKRRMFWKVLITPARAMRLADRPSIGAPSRRIRPAVGANTPERQLSNVVLPLPFGPISPAISPGASRSDTPRNACTPPKRLTSSTPSSTPAAVCCLLSARAASALTAPILRRGSCPDRGGAVDLHEHVLLRQPDDEERRGV